MLSQKAVDTILQNTQEYLKLHELADSYNHQSKGAKSDLLQQNVTPQRKPAELNMNQKLEQPSLPPKTHSNNGRSNMSKRWTLLHPGRQSFITTLRAELERRRIKLTLTDVKSLNANEAGSNLVMVICNNHSRLQANVANASRDIPRNSFRRILRAVLHCKKERLLPSASSKAEFKDDREFGVIPEVVDFAFDKDETTGGLYECEFNKRAFDIIENLVESGRLVSVQADASGSSHKKKRIA